MNELFYYAFAAGLAAGVVLTVGSFALIALRALGEEDLPEDEPPRHRQYQD